MNGQKPACKLHKKDEWAFKWWEIRKTKSVEMGSK